MSDNLPNYPQFVPDEVDMEQLARTYLEESIELVCFSVYTGTCEWKQAYRLMHRFETVAKHLGETKRRQIIDGVDAHEGRTRGDSWHVFKRAFEAEFFTGFFTTPVDNAAVKRVADEVFKSLPADAPAELFQGDYGSQFLDILENARQEPFMSEWGEAEAAEEDPSNSKETDCNF